MKKTFIPLMFVFILFGCTNIFAHETKRLDSQPNLQCSNVTLTLNFDNFPNETGWSIVDANGITVAAGDGYTAADSTATINECLPYGCYSFVIKDTGGNGICCGFGNGSYTLTDDATGNVLTSGGAFSSSERTNFCLDEPTSCAKVGLRIRFDKTPQQTSWEITDANGGLVASSGGTYATNLANTGLALPEVACLPDGCYDLTFFDAINNGMCPFQSNAAGVGTFVTPGTLVPVGSIVATLGAVASPSICGNYVLYGVDGTLIASGGGAFGASETTNFCLVNGMAQRIVQDTEALINIYPTLASEWLTIDYNGNDDIQINIMDVNGRILQQHAPDKHAAPTFTLNISDIPTGIHFIQTLTANGVIMTEKFVKQ